MGNYCYAKKYVTSPYGGSVLSNPEPLECYNNSRYKMLLSTHGDPAAQRAVKLQIISEFLEIYNYDVIHSEYPEPFGSFDSDEEKKDFIRKHILHSDFIHYLGSILGGYHRDIASSGNIIVPKFSSYVVDFDEVYRTAYIDYACVLLEIQKNVCFHFSEDSDEIAKPITESAITPDGKYINIPGSEDGKKPPRVPHAVTATYIYPSLVEQALIMYLENSIIYKWLYGIKAALENGMIVLNEKEESIYNAFAQMKKAGSGKISGNRRTMLKNIWDIGEKHGVLKNNGGMKNIMYGKNDGDDLTLGDMLGNDYVATQIRQEYLKLMKLLFGRKNLNFRNMVAHGDRATIDYLHIAYVSIMHQMLFDIANNDVFV